LHSARAAFLEPNSNLLLRKYVHAVSFGSSKLSSLPSISIIRLKYWFSGLQTLFLPTKQAFGTIMQDYRLGPRYQPYLPCKIFGPKWHRYHKRKSIANTGCVVFFNIFKSQMKNLRSTDCRMQIEVIGLSKQQLHRIPLMWYSYPREEIWLKCSRSLTLHVNMADANDG